MRFRCSLTRPGTAGGGSWRRISPAAWSHRHTATAFMGLVSKSPSSAGTLILKPFLAAVTDVDGVEFAALDTLQHGLARDAEGAHGVDDRHEAGGRLLDEQRAQLVVDADPPGSTGRVLLAGDEAVAEPAVQCRGRDAEHLGGPGDREQLAVGRLGGRLVRGDAAVAAQTADDDRGEALAGGGSASLAVEDAGDRRVVVVDREPAEQLDRVLVGVDRGLGAR